MSFADPQSITIDGVTTSLPRVSTGDRRSIYQSGDGYITLTASSQLNAKRTRRVLRVDYIKVSADPFIADLSAERSMSVYTVFDLPKYGFTAEEAKDVYNGLKTQAAASSDALIVKLLGGES